MKAEIILPDVLALHNTLLADAAQRQQPEHAVRSQSPSNSYLHTASSQCRAKAMTVTGPSAVPSAVLRSPAIQASTATLRLISAPHAHSFMTVGSADKGAIREPVPVPVPGIWHHKTQRG